MELPPSLAMAYGGATPQRNVNRPTRNDLRTAHLTVPDFINPKTGDLMPNLTRRRMVALSDAKFTAVACLPALAQEHSGASVGVRRNLSGFRAIRWQDHFDTLQTGAIVRDTPSMALHFWSADGDVQRTYPCSVPRTGQFARRGRTGITLKRRNTTWIPTPDMRARDPELPEWIGPGPENPMGTRALNLTWQ